MKEIKYTKHAKEKFLILSKYGFVVDKVQIEEAINSPDLFEKRDEEMVFTKIISQRYAIRVICKKKGRLLKVITFYPIRRRKYGI
jgi:hypothetical protein